MLAIPAHQKGEVLSDTETLRSSLGTKASIAREKSKTNSDINGNTMEQDTSETNRFDVLMKMKNAELKQICKDNKLLISGAKSVLVQRILEYEQSQSVLPEERNNDSNVTESNTNETPISSVLGPNDIEVEDTFGYESVYGNQMQDEEEEYNDMLFREYYSNNE